MGRRKVFWATFFLRFVVGVGCFKSWLWVFHVKHLRAIVVRVLLIFVARRFKFGWLFECGAECCCWFWSGAKFACCACLFRGKLFSAKNVSFLEKYFKMSMYKLQVGASNDFRACGRREMDCVRKFPVNFLTELLFGKGCFGLCFT